MTQEEIDTYIQSPDLSILIGKKISQLLHTDRMLSDTVFLLSRKENDQYYSKSIDYNSLLYQIAEDISSYLHLSSMAFREHWEYSKVNHTHDYNYAVCNPTYELSDFPDKTKVSCICEILTSNSATNNVVSVFYPPYEEPPRTPPYVGEVMLMGRHWEKSPYQIQTDILNGTFDGWVYADGGTYQSMTNHYDFSEAFTYFGGYGTTFQVPRFENYLRFNGLNVNSYGHNLVPWQNFPQAHTHSVVADVSGIKGQAVNVQISIKGDTQGTSGGSSGKGLHLNYGGTRTSWLTNITADITLNGIDATASFGWAKGYQRETQPIHTILPCMVYIGSVRR